MFIAKDKREDAKQKQTMTEGTGHNDRLVE